MTDQNQSPRAMLNTADPNAIRIVYRAPIDPVMKKCLCLMGTMNLCSGLLCKREEIYNSTYVQVHENRLEINYPGLKTMPCCRSVRDSIEVFYFDNSRIANVAKAGCCTPCCTHNSCCPTWCGLCGEMAVFLCRPTRLSSRLSRPRLRARASRVVLSPLVLPLPLVS